MAKPLSIYFICGAGLGSSLACQMEAEEVLASNGISATLHHESVSSVPAISTDIIVSAENFRPQIEKHDVDPATDVVYLRNIVDKTEISEKLLPVIAGREA